MSVMLVNVLNSGGSVPVRLLALRSLRQGMMRFQSMGASKVMMFVARQAALWPASTHSEVSPVHALSALAIEPVRLFETKTISVHVQLTPVAE